MSISRVERQGVALEILTYSYVCCDFAAHSFLSSSQNSSVFNALFKCSGWRLKKSKVFSKLYTQAD